MREAQNSLCEPKRPALLKLLALGALFLLITPIRGITIATNLHSFTGPDGSHPRATLALSNDGLIYGTTLQGGASNVGTVFRIGSDGVFTNLHSFSVSDGSGAMGISLGRDGNFYGTTTTGGKSTNGTIFRISPNGEFASLYSFDRTNGGRPFAPLIQAQDGNFYGTTFIGGLNDKGTVYRITPDGQLTSLHSFSPTDGEGANPYGPLVEGSDGIFYGTTQSGGTSVPPQGTIFRVSSTGTFETLHSFKFPGASTPFGGLALGPDGNFYGTTSAGGTNTFISGTVYGTVYRMTPDGAVTVLHTFVSSEGHTPQAGLFLANDGNFYGTTTAGGFANLGTIFRITPGGSFGLMHSFVAKDGGTPVGGVIQNTDGSFYCTTYTNGAAGLGSVFKLSIPLFIATNQIATCSPAVLTTLHSFSGTDGSLLNSELALNADGNFVGTTIQGGNSDLGTIFVVTPSGAFTNLHKFAGFPVDGQNPYGGLAPGPGNNFYGTAVAGGTAGAGAFFRMGPAGNVTILHSFVAATDGNSPESSLIAGSDGDFYGTCTGGGPGKRGTAFRVTSAGQVKVLHSFSGLDGSTPFAGLVEGSNGVFYGTTYNGGAASTGTVYRVTSDGTFTNLHTFSGPDGSYPHSELVRGVDGNFYGTTVTGGSKKGCPNGCGTIFRITPNGEFTSVYSFDGTDGSSPFSALLLGHDGNFYGTTDGGADFTGIGGSIFKFTSAGQLTTIYSFTGGDDGRGPLARLVQGRDGALYGTTSIGGSSANCLNGCGSVFRLCIPGGEPSAGAAATAELVGNNIIVHIVSESGKSFQLQSRNALGGGNWSDAGSPVSGTGAQLSLSIPLDSKAPEQFFRFVIQ